MSLATRCTHCGTIFKIVEDQLKVSEGWVRCGRCQEVFNALPTLFDMENEAPPPRRAAPPVAPAEPSPPPASPEPPAKAPQQAVVTPPPAPLEKLTQDTLPPEPPAPMRAATDFELDTRVPAEEMNWGRRVRPDAMSEAAPRTPAAVAAPVSDTPPPAPLAPPPLPEAELPSTDEADALDSRYLMPSDERPAPRRRSRGPEFADAQFPTDALQDLAPAWEGSSPAPAAAAAPVAPPTPSAPKPEPEPRVAKPAAAAVSARAPTRSSTGKPARAPASKKAMPPEFIRRAQRQAFWRQPSVRGMLTGLTLALLLSMGLQVVHQFRNTLAAQYPALRPLLTQWCQLAQCKLQAPLRIEDLLVDNATLLRASSEGPDRYSLTVVVRNRSGIELAWPHVDLSLTDLSGKIVARRSFAPNDAQWHDGSEPTAPAGPLPAAVPARHSTTLVWQLHAPGLQPAGYTAELFYP